MQITLDEVQLVGTNLTVVAPYIDCGKGSFYLIAVLAFTRGQKHSSLCMHHVSCQSLQRWCLSLLLRKLSLWHTLA